MIPAIAKPVPTFLILDQCTHSPRPGRQSRPALDEGFNTFLCYLPPYSPELNMIEILWKQAKYHWREVPLGRKMPFDQNQRTARWVRL
ncbi:MAG: transposase [Betaproteobacteria bacterium]|nr:transposase [Betaproteobacteria bacterium]